MSKRELHEIRISTRRNLYKSQKGICTYCLVEIPITQASLDHIIPVHHLNEISNESNLTMCCKSCNYNKHNYIVFTNLEDRIIYPIIDIPYFNKKWRKR